MRRLLTALVAMLGIVLMIVGIVGAQPVPGQSDPRLLGGATLWIGGIMLLLVSPAVYSLVSD